MKKTGVVLVGGVLVAGIMVITLVGGGDTSEPVAQVPIPMGDDNHLTTFKSPSCGCCTGWADHMEDKSYQVELEESTDLNTIKEKYGVPTELYSCHTSLIAGYVVEGHIPEVAVKKLIEERPDIRGIALAGMPSGTPGMPGPKYEPYIIYEITHDGKKGDVFMEM